VQRAESGVERSLPLSSRLREAASALTDLDPVRAEAWLRDASDVEPSVAYLRARIALAKGDCELAAKLMSTQSNVPPQELETLRVAEGCSRAMAGAEVVQEESKGVWIRLQNSRDRVLVPLLADVADRAAKSIERRLRTRFPRPIRIELVSDLPSLSYLTGLPLEAAETTGTIAIARWGKVTVLSPRATRDGFPWQDTLAHELAHLGVSRKSGDEAPLWLQEGIAKRLESRWRAPLPQDDARAARRQVKMALRDGRTVGIDRLGPSIAMLPSPELAATAYAEVEDFLAYFVEQSGERALELLLVELRSLGSSNTDQALRGVSGYSLAEWMRKWQHVVASDTVSDAESSPEAHVDYRNLRLGMLLGERRHWAASIAQLERASASGPRDPEANHRVALAHLILGHPHVAEATLALADERRFSDGTWLSIQGRVEELLGHRNAAESAFERSLSFAPTLERVACRGAASSDREDSAGSSILPTIEPWRSLCLDARGTSVP
jgi:hypothetical protein